MKRITLITPTVDRPEAFALCEEWILRQTFEGHIQWIVADGGKDAIECTLNQDHIRIPYTKDKNSSLCLNLLTALEYVEHDKVLFIEDDDWYHEDYLNFQYENLKDVILFGEQHAKYYNVNTQKQHVVGNSTHASLCQTGITDKMLPLLKKILKASVTGFIDIKMWSAQVKKRLAPDSNYCVGMKGLPGTKGIGIGHRNTFGVDDPNWETLEKWIGKDAEKYKKYLGNRS